MEKKEVFISGYAKLPMGITAWELYRVIAIGLLVEKQSGEILAVDCTLVTSVAKQFINSILVGENLNNIDVIIKKFEETYYGSAKKALITAVKICQRKYEEITFEDK